MLKAEISGSCFLCCLIQHGKIGFQRCLYGKNSNHVHECAEDEQKRQKMRDFTFVWRDECERGEQNAQTKTAAHGNHTESGNHAYKK